MSAASPVPSAALPGVNVCGYLRSESGLGEAARGYVRALRCLGVPLTFQDLSDTAINRAQDHTLRQAQDEAAAKGAAAEHAINLICMNPDKHGVVLSRLGERYFEGRYNIGVWAWELPRFPDKWFDRFAYYDEIWVGTSFIANALAPVAPVPIVRVPPILTHDTSGDRARGRARIAAAHGEFVFLFVFDFTSLVARKNPAAVIDAFRAAFAPADGAADAPADAARLVIKSVNAAATPAEAEALRQRARGLRVDFHDGYVTRAEMQDLMAACDAYVSLHRAEGTGLTLSDAAAAGKPVIATDWSGNTDFLDAANSYPVRYDLVQLAQSVGPYAAGETWADPSVAHAAELMRHVYGHRDEAAGRGERARRDIANGYGERPVRELVARRLRAIGTRQRFADFRRDARRSYAAYRESIERAHEVVSRHVRRGGIVAVVSRGDEELVAFGGGRVGWHFPRTESGAYAGHHPADGDAAIAHLDAVRAAGATHLLLPAASFWWREHYATFARHLESGGGGGRVFEDEHCALYALAPADGGR